MKTAVSRQLYQLRSKNKLNVGDYVAINGPYDTYGIVLKSDTFPYGHLNLIRGCPAKAGLQPVAEF